MLRAQLFSIVSITLVALSSSACSQNEEQLAVATALDRTITAMESGDMSALWEITAPAAQDKLTELHAELHQALALVDQVYPEASRDEVRKALGQAIVGDIPLDAKDAGPRLLERILDPKAIRLDEKARDGLRSRRATIDGDKAEIHTSADEKFTFQKTEGEWRSGLVFDLVDQSQRFSQLRENARKVLEARDSQRQAWIESRDPKTPHGGYNLLRQVLADKPLKSQVIFSLLDKKTRAVVLETLTTARVVQKLIQRRSKKAKRRALYKKYSISDYVKLETDRGLFALWVQSDGFVSPLADLFDKPESVEGKEATGQVSIVTAKKTKVTMLKGEDGVWRISDYGAVLSAKLLAPVKASQDLLAKPKSKTKPAGTVPPTKK